MGDYVAIIGIIVSVILALGLLLLGIIGWLVTSRLTSIEASVGHIPALQQDIVAMKVKLDQHGSALEKHMNNAERIAVLERDVRVNTEEIANLRPAVHDLRTNAQINMNLITELKLRVEAKGP